MSLYFGSLALYARSHQCRMSEFILGQTNREVISFWVGEVVEEVEDSMTPRLWSDR